MKHAFLALTLATLAFPALSKSIKHPTCEVLTTYAVPAGTSEMIAIEMVSEILREKGYSLIEVSSSDWVRLNSSREVAVRGMNDELVFKFETSELSYCNANVAAVMARRSFNPKYSIHKEERLFMKTKTDISICGLDFMTTDRAIMKKLIRKADLNQIPECEISR